MKHGRVLLTSLHSEQGGVAQLVAHRLVVPELQVIAFYLFKRKDSLLFAHEELEML